MSGNGDVMALVQVQGPIVLEPATAGAYLSMKAAAAREGVNVEIPTPAGGYRSLYMQRDMHERPWAYNLDPRSSVQLAPVGYSTHGWGDRVDIIVGRAREWAIANAHRFGFEREFGDADPGHFKFIGGGFAGDITEPIPAEQEDDMNGFYIHADSAGPKYYFSPATGKVRLIPSDEWSFLRALDVTRGGIDIKLVLVSQSWLDKALALG